MAQCPHFYVEFDICNNCGELMTTPEPKKITQITDPRILQFALSVLKFWEPIEFEGKFYYRTFQDNVYLKD